MPKTLKEYFGSRATTNGVTLSISIPELADIIEPRVVAIDNAEDPDLIVSLVLLALHKTTKPYNTTDGTSYIDKHQAVISQVSVPTNVAVERAGSKQVEHKVNFNIYTSDYQFFPIDRIV